MPEGGEERRIVTVLFADLAGSTALTEQLDPEDAKLILGDAIARVIRVVESYGGFVKDLAGDGVLAFFGAPTAHEDDPERATRAGLEIVQAVAAYSAEVESGWGLSGLAVRVGIHSGEVVVGLVGGGGRVEYGAVGDPVNVAARLQGGAEPGTVIVSETTRRSIVDQFEWSEGRELDLKGKSQPVLAHRALRPSSAASAAPGSTGARTPLIGREVEVEILERTATSLAAGQGGILMVSGEPGIGKSRIVAEFRDRIGRSGGGVRWLEGRCVSYGESLPYWAYRDLLRSWLGIGSQDPELRVRVALQRQLDRLFGDRAQEAFPFLGAILGLHLDREGAGGLGQISAEAIQYRTFQVVAEVVSHLCAQGPLVLAVDDVHWADRTSLALTEHLMALTETQPLLLVLVSRPETEHPSWQLKERAAREYRHLFRELALTPLPVQSESALLDALAAGQALDARSKQRILEYSAGNAFYMEEIVRSMAEAGPGSGAGAPALAIPATIEGVLLARLDRLDPAWRELLTAASILGRSFTLELLCAVSGQSSEAAQEALHHLLRLDLLQSDRSGGGPAYRFKHALIQETAYRTLVAASRERLHRRAAEWFESFYGANVNRVFGLIAHHWQGADDRAKAAHYLRLAGDAAFAEWALDEAIDRYRAVLPLLEGPEAKRDAAELLFQLGSTLHLAMRYREANEVWQEGFSRWSYPEPTGVPATASFRVATNQVPWTTDVRASYYATNQSLFQQTWDRLLEARPAPYVVPGLASWWEVSEDGLSYRFRLREGVRWKDGRPMVAADVVACLRGVMDPERPSLNATMLLVLENGEACSRGSLPLDALGVRAVDELTFEVRLNRRVPHLLFYFTYPELGSTRADLDGSGPFQLTALTPELVTVERDPTYERRRGGNLARIEWVLSPDPEALAVACREGQVDAVWGHVPLALSEAEMGLVRLPAPATQTGFVAFLGTGELVCDRWLRRALAMAIDREPLGRALAGYQEEASGGLVPPGIAGHTPEIALRFDPEAARRELARSSHRGVFTMAIGAEHHRPYLDLLVEMWRTHLGLEVTVFVEPMARNLEWRTRAHASNWQWVAHAPDPEYFLRNLLHGQSLSKLGGWALPELDALLDRATETADGAERLVLYHQADRMAVEEAVVIPLSYGGVRWSVKPWVHGVWQWGSPWQSWDEVTIDSTQPPRQG